MRQLIIVLLLLISKPELRNPTFDELMLFLNKSTVNFNEYVGGEYTCLDFARDLQAEATEAGIRSAVVVVRYPVYAHALNVFETTDAGMIYWEPIYDHRMMVEVGIKYWWWLELKAWYDDTIEHVCFYWDRIHRSQYFCP